MDAILFITPGALATFLLEFFKWLIRRFTPTTGFDFPPLFYEIGLPLVTFLSSIILGVAGLVPMPEFTLTYIIQWVLGVAIAMGTYYITLKPLKTYREAWKENN